MERYDVDSPRWDQSKFYGRLRYFIAITDPRKIFTKKETLMQQKLLLKQYKEGNESKDTTMEDIYRAQAYYGSAFHPDTGEVQNIAGRMCANVYGGTILCGAMMIWYRDLLVAYSSAVAGALGVAVGLKKYLAKKAASVTMQRLVPLIAVAFANAINIPLMRQK